MNSLNWIDALDIVVWATKHERYRWLCSDENSDHEAWRREMIRMATGELPDPPKGKPETKGGCCG
jgi:hypothetical protein